MVEAVWGSFLCHHVPNTRIMQLKPTFLIYYLIYSTWVDMHNWKHNFIQYYMYSFLYIYIYIHKYSVCEHTRLYIFKYVCVYVSWICCHVCTSSLFCDLVYQHSLLAKFLRTVLHLEVYISRWLFTPRNLGPWFNHYLSWCHASIKNIFQCIRKFALFVFRNRLFFDVASLNRPWTSGLGRWKFLPIAGSSWRWRGKQWGH